MSNPNILVLNPGSSSLKFGVYHAEQDDASRPVVQVKGVVEFGAGQAMLHLKLPEAQKPSPIKARTPGQATEQVLRMLSENGELANAINGEIGAVGCRVVHGGSRFSEAMRVTPEVLDEIEALSRLAPLHNPVSVEVIEAVGKALPKVPIVAVFDTAFHHDLPLVASTYALPFALCEAHQLRRYGFHGISHQFISERLLECLGREAAGTRLITCHLGNGASVCAIRDGKSVDTSMGLTPLEGLVMGTRSGDVDPGLILYLQREAKMSTKALDDLLNHQSGLLGISGRSGDVRELEQAVSAGDTRAKLALSVFSYRIRKYLGAYTIALEGVDAIAFAGGIGEHSASVRAHICGSLGFLGVRFDASRNQSADGNESACLTKTDSPVQVWLIPTDEESQIAREVGVTLWNN